MRIKILFMVLLIASLPAAVFASGKLHGKVVDKDTGEPLVGATVSLVGTTRGAVTDLDGYYTILQVETGTYTVQASYVGYQAVQIANVRVNENLTAEQNFSLAKSAIQVAPVEIVAQRPLIEKSATNETRIVGSDFLQSVPLRSVTEVAALQPGVVLRNNLVYMRGSRADETGFLIDGVNVTDPYYGGRGVTISQDAVEQIQVQAGGYPAEYGGANGGLVSTQLRTGGQQMHLSLRAETDNYTKQGKKSLGGYSYGYSDYVASLSGPIVSDKVRFFGTVENQFYRDPGTFGALFGTGSSFGSASAAGGGGGTNASIANPGYWNGINFNGLIPEPQYTVASPNALTTDTLNLSYPAGNRIGGQLNQYSYTGTLLFDLGDIQLRGAGSFTNVFSQNPANIHNFLDAARLPINKYQNGFGNIKLTQFFDPKTYYELNLNYYRVFNQTGLDPKYGMDVTNYGSPASNPSLNGGAATLDNSFWNVFGPTSGGGLSIFQPGTLLAAPAISSETSIGGRLDFSTTTDKNALKFGGEYTYYTLRRFAPAAVDGVYKIMNNGALSLTQKEAALRYSGYDNYGYNVLGNVINSDEMVGNTIVDFGPPHPINGAIYIQDQIQLPDINLNVGLRYDYINPDSWDFVNPNGVTYVDSLTVISASSLKKTPVSQQISPRIGVSFPVTDLTVFHAQYGKFIQEAELLDSYAGMGAMYALVHGGNYIQPPSGFGLKPVRTTSYEIGFSQQVGDNASFDVTTFYKDIQDEIQARLVQGTPRNYYTLVNGDFATSKGVELKITLRRINRLEAQLNYTFASAEGTGSSANSSEGSASDQRGYTANIPFPNSFSQESTGSLSLDYRYAKDDGGPILQRAGVNLLMTFGSGYPVTLETVSQNNLGDARFQVPLEPIGYSTTPWSFEIDLRVDKTVSFGPLDAMFYIYVQNLLNTRNADNVFIRTGDPSNDGWLGIPTGQAYAASQSNPAQYQSVYNAAYLGDNSGNFTTPRQIRFGVQIDY